jgi:cysteine desulfuration protein SufE
MFGSWQEKYEYLIEIGRNMPVLEAKFKTNKHVIEGCQSKVWLRCEEKDKKLYFYGDSDALITKGLLALVIMLYSGLSKKEFVGQGDDVIRKIGLVDHLSMTRANGLQQMLKKIQEHAH